MRRMRLPGLVVTALLAATIARADLPQPDPGKLVPEGIQARPVDTVEALLSLDGLEDDQWFIVGGYHRPGDSGGGVFRYRAASQTPDNGGTVLGPRQGTGRLLRAFDPEADVYAEWFGAWGDGDQPDAHADEAAINACLRTFGRVRLLAKTYGVRGTPEPWDAAVTYKAIELGPDYRIEGMGRDQTRVRLLDGTNPHGAGPSENYFVIMFNRAFHESADNVVVRDLTIDCNFDGQNKETTIHAIQIRGGNALVERVNFRHYGTGRNPENGSSRECFVIHQSLVYKDRNSSRRGAVLRDLDFTDPGHNGMLEGGVAEITHIAVGGAHNFGDLSWITAQGKDPAWDPANNGENENNWWPSYGGLVENVTIHDVAFDPSVQKSPLNGITYADSVGMVVRGNRVERFDGAGVFVMSWWNKGCLICDNEFLDVAYGVTLNMTGVDGKPNECPSHRDVLCERNTIRLAAPTHILWGPCGIQLYGEALGDGIRMENMIFRGNTVSGRAFENDRGQRVCPLAIKVQILHENYRRLILEDNVIDTPDFPPEGIAPREPFGQSMFLYPSARWESDSRTGNVVFRNNRTPDGRLLYPYLASWTFDNEPQYGKPFVPGEPLGAAEWSVCDHPPGAAQAKGRGTDPSEADGLSLAPLMCGDNGHARACSVPNCTPRRRPGVTCSLRRS